MNILLTPNVGLSKAVHDELDNIVARTTNKKINTWKGNFMIIIDSLTGGVEATPTDQNTAVSQNFRFNSKINSPLSVLPTPDFMWGSKQLLYVCFSSEVPGLIAGYSNKFISCNS